MTFFLVADLIDEDDETLNFTLSNAQNAAIPQATRVLTIVNDDSPPEISMQTSVSHTEPSSGTNTLMLHVGLSAASGKTITVDYATTVGTATSPDDFAAASGTLTFAPGQSAKSVSISVVGDGAAEGDETFTFSLSNPSNATVNTASATVTLKDPGNLQTEIWVWGDNYYGSAGTGDKQIVHFSIHVAPQLDGAKYVVTGSDFISVLASDGTVWAWGNNEYGQLGDPNAGNERLTPGQVPGLSDIVEIEVAGQACFALDTNGTAYAWGRNYSTNELGLGVMPNVVASPQAISGMPPIERLNYGSALDVNGDVWCWGSGTSGEIGDGLFADQPTPKKVAALSGVDRLFSAGTCHFVVLGNNDVYAWGHNVTGVLGTGGTTNIGVPSRVQALQGFSTFFVSASLVFGRKANGDTYAWGYDLDGGMGFGSPSGTVTTPIRAQHLDSFTYISAGVKSVAFGSANNVWVWGENLSALYL